MQDDKNHECQNDPTVLRLINAGSFHFSSVYFFKCSDFVLPATKGQAFSSQDSRRWSFKQDIATYVIVLQALAIQSVAKNMSNVS